MDLIFVLFVNCLILHYGVGQDIGFDCDLEDSIGSSSKSEIHLIGLDSSEVWYSPYDTDPYKYIPLGNENEIHKLNIKFIQKCDQFYNFVDAPIEDDDIGFNMTLEMIKSGKTVINLFAKDYYNYQKNIDASKVMYAGDVYDDQNLEYPKTSDNKKVKSLSDINDYGFFELSYDTDKQHVRTVSTISPLYNGTNSMDSETDDNPQKNNDTTPIVRPTPPVKLVSEYVANLDSGHLLDFISSIYLSDGKVQSWETCQHIPETEHDLKTVIICTDDHRNCFDTPPHSKEMNFKFVPLGLCNSTIETYRNSLVAVLAPKPFEMNFELIVPTVFYKTPYMDPAIVSQFPYAVHLVDDQLLKYAILRTITEAGWIRVAIISDDSLYSIELEDALVKEFNRNKMIYNVQRCEKKACDFQKALTNLLNMDARIIIANVEEENAKVLYNLASGYSKWITFLFRVWPFWSPNRLPISQSLSITLGPKTLESYKSCNTHINNIPSCSAILDALRIIYLARKAVYSPALNRADFYRSFTSKLKSVRTESVGYVRRADGELLSIISFNNNGVKEYKKYKNLFQHTPKDGPNCYDLTKNFEKPCDTTAVVLFMFVIMAFSIILLLIIFYFDDTSPIHAINYQQM